MTLDDALRRLMTYSRSLSLIRTFDGRWQASARMPNGGHVYNCHHHDDPATALRMCCDAPPPHGHAAAPIDEQCRTCSDTGWRYGEIGVPCNCGKHDLFGGIFT